MQACLKVLFSLSLLFFGWSAIGSKAVAAESCRATFSDVTRNNGNHFYQKACKEAALEIMMEGSLNVSRTKSLGRRFMAPPEIKDAQIAELAEVNFRKAAEYMLENFESLELNLETAVTLDKILTEGLVSENVRGQYNFRQFGAYSREIDRDIGKVPDDFYITWLNSPTAKSLFKTSPVEFAEIVHNTIMSLDSFPDGNGRLSRLFSDLALIKSNLSPAYYTSMKDYFERGNSRAGVSRETRKQYFYEIVRRGMSRLGLKLERIPVKKNLSEALPDQTRVSLLLTRLRVPLQVA